MELYPIRNSKNGYTELPVLMLYDGAANIFNTVAELLPSVTEEMPGISPTSKPPEDINPMYGLNENVVTVEYPEGEL